MSRICILGGGFGGLYTALQLNQLPWTVQPEIILIDRNDRFVFSPLLYELITGELETWEIAPTFSELLSGSGVRFVQGNVTDIDIANCQVSLTNSLLPTEVISFKYDRLVLALGGETPVDLVSGALEYAIPFRTLADAQRLQLRLLQLEQSKPEKIRVCIAGAGSSGVELACKISDRLQGIGRVRIVDRNTSILANSPISNRIAAERALASRGIWTDLCTNVAHIGDGEILLNYASGSDTLPVDIVLWTVGNSLSKLARSLNLPHSSGRGQIIIEPTLQVQGHEQIFALGDIAECRDPAGQILPATAQVAFQQAQYCARNVWASLNQHALIPFTYLALGEFMSLGKDNAAMSIFGQFGVEGVPALIARRLAYLLRMPTFQHQVKVGFNWLSRPLFDFLKGSR
ncbi:NADH dehydrogenase, FAD-containing subunit [Synechococcus sp. PCC 7502]|uniref:NAD(P)/FAD-dependent oxidoreductase n=1 Tax=Synechococcus sp. PCC 7502 TaxID=1173263 RepID=UPI00029FF609|nr:NAD(P)/FAD-dependent oxidoreductase [Synechococcus sp. PCC 7502]AFY72993.1 NADH dehydrogenase, FAD-containing subunit [Synechococcus sp. PCC 7502]